MGRPNVTRFDRIILLVLDSVGVGEMPDAGDFGDAGSDTLGPVVQSRPLTLPNLQALGLANIRPLENLPPVSEPAGNFGRLTLASRGKDSTSGHWEMMGLVLDSPFPIYPDGLPDEVIQPFEAAIGCPILANRGASGTQIIAELGEEHVLTGRPIVYTSADSVFQIAAHGESFGLDRLYQICEVARGQLTGRHEVGRVIARPFVGSSGQFVRTANRRDYAIPPFIDTGLDHLVEAEVSVTAVGKIASVFCYRGISSEVKSGGNGHTTDQTLRALSDVESGLVFSNFLDFDTLYGHCNDVPGYAKALEGFDLDLYRILPRIGETDLLIITSDHGCDPSTASTDHSREYALLLTYSAPGRAGVDLGTRGSLADIGATVAENFGVAAPAGKSFLGEL